MTLGELREMTEGCREDAELVICDGELCRPESEHEPKRLFICRETVHGREQETVILKI